MAQLPAIISNGLRSLARVAGFRPDAAPEDPNTPPDLDSIYSISPESLILGSFANYIKPIAPNDATSLKREGLQDLRLYDRLLDDDVAMSTLQQRRLAITSRDWEVTPGDDTDPRSVRAADEFRAMLKALRFDLATGGLHYAIWYGYGVGEALWTTREFEGRRIVWLDAILVPDRRWFGFTMDGELRYTAALGLYGEEVPPNKFVVIRTGGTHDFAFYGLGLAHWAYWPIWFKRVALKFWAIYLEKLANPTAVGEFKESDTEGAKRKLISALLAIGRDSAVILPENTSEKVKFMEAQRTGSGSSSYKDFVTESNEALMRIILGQPGTSKSTPQGIGSGQAEVHEGVKAEFVKADSDLICEAINDSFAKWLTGWNHGDDVAPPKVYRVLDDAEDLNSIAERDEKVGRLGWERTDESFAQVYGEGYQRKPQPTNPPPVPGQRPSAANDDDVEEARRARAQFAAGDEMPLSVSRRLRNVASIRKWAQSQGIANVDDDLHATVLYSRTPVDPFKMGQSWSEVLTVPEGGPRKVEVLGDKLVLRFQSSDIEWRHEEMIRNGASHDFPDFRLHVSIADADGLDPEAIEPYQGELVFGPELFEPLRLDPDPLSTFSAFDAIEEDEIDRLAAALAEESNPLISEFAATAIDSLRSAREARGGRLSAEGARVALLEAFERFDTAALARLTGLPLLAERAASEAGVEDRVDV